MEGFMAIVVGIFFTVAIYLMLSQYIIRILLGVAILGNAVNMLLFVAGRVTREAPPIIGKVRTCCPPRPPIRCRRR